MKRRNWRTNGGSGPLRYHMAPEAMVAYRALHGATQVQLAEVIGCTSRQVQRYEAGDAPIPTPIVRLLQQKGVRNHLLGLTGLGVSSASNPVIAEREQRLAEILAMPHAGRPRTRSSGSCRIYSTRAGSAYCAVCGLPRDEHRLSRASNEN